jgi:hypothetical protein
MVDIQQDGSHQCGSQERLGQSRPEVPEEEASRQEVSGLIERTGDDPWDRVGGKRAVDEENERHGMTWMLRKSIKEAIWRPPAFHGPWYKEQEGSGGCALLHTAQRSSYPAARAAGPRRSPVSRRAPGRSGRQNRSRDTFSHRNDEGDIPLTPAYVSLFTFSSTDGGPQGHGELLKKDSQVIG